MGHGKTTLLIVPLTLQLVWLFALALPIASIAWTITHEEVFRVPREYCIRQSESHPNPACRKFFFIFTCEFCFSHYVTAFFLLITRYKLLFDDWRGYLIAFCVLPWLANQWMSIYRRLRVSIKHENAEAETAKVELREEKKKAASS